ncbi:LapA family protein [Caminicella sporogenes]|uniref:LapA family protein n=1 Tax=Caminicella sporogenes TaxID=166485 RepID=UPI00253FFFDE|nr:LapA family protein [Caminicella sporogenes]WIF94371.1 LapA family protein [Caminicella sporogenes]
MQILFILSLLFAVFVSIFAIMNSEPVTIKLLWKQYQFSQAIIILGAASMGAIIVALLGLFKKLKSTLKIRELQNRIKILEKEIVELKEKTNIEKEKIPTGDTYTVLENKKNTIELNQGKELNNKELS